MFVVGAGLFGGMFALSHFWKGAVERASRSYDTCIAAYELRVEKGWQPATPIVNLYSVDVQEKLLILGNIGYLLATCGLYLFMVRREKPFQLKRILTIYNLVNVCVSAYVSGMILHHKFTKQPGFICNRGEPGDPGLAYVFAVYYCQKAFEFMDTYFFILRKSFRQVTFLHLFHHASIIVIVGSLLPFDFDGDMYLPILLNSIVHVCVYLHYFLTCLGYHSWWSRYLTSMQMGQFAFILVQSVMAYLEGPSCGSPDFSKLLMMGYMGSMLVLFSDFFIKRYILKKPAYDMCGVIKSVEFTGGPITSTYHGNAKLNGSGQALVRMPRHFTDGISDTLYCYQLTPVGTAMPDLHVAQEMTKIKQPGGPGGGASGPPGGYAFLIAGGKPNGSVSWMVAVVTGDDKVRLH